MCVLRLKQKVLLKQNEYSLHFAIGTCCECGVLPGAPGARAVPPCRPWPRLWLEGPSSSHGRSSLLSSQLPLPNSCHWQEGEPADFKERKLSPSAVKRGAERQMETRDRRRRCLLRLYWLLASVLSRQESAVPMVRALRTRPLCTPTQVQVQGREKRGTTPNLSAKNKYKIY